MKRCTSLIVLLMAVACGPAAPPQPTAPPEPDPDLLAKQAMEREAAAATAARRAEHEARLSYLAEALERVREEQHIPGMAVAVVQNGQVVLSRGFGVRDLDSKEPVTPRTLFAIGSTTKAFTSALVAMMVDEGLMDWDDPLSRHVPGLRLKVKPGSDGGGEATVRDALCHRTGFPRMSVLWVGGQLSQAEIFRYASQAEPTAPLRESFQYNNLIYAAAGVAAGNAAGSSWDALVHARLFIPLDMTDSVTTAADAKGSGLLASGYTWYRDLDRHERENLRDIPSVAPAGAIFSNIQDMATWVRFQLAGGIHDGGRIIGEANLTKTHEFQIEINEDLGYGMGWMVRAWQGQRYVEHGGNIDGFAASVGFLPEAGVGYVFLSNVSSTPVQESVGPLIFEALLGELPGGDEDAAPKEDFEPYVGEYEANFGPFRDARFKVLVNEDGKLAVDVPGQQVFELEPPDEQGRRGFAITDQISVSFERADDGRVLALYVHQAGFDFEAPRHGVTQPMRVEPAEVGPYLGGYESTEDKKSLTVGIHAGRLALDVPGQGRAYLDAPDKAGGDWVVRMKRSWYVSFKRGKGGAVESLTVHRDDGEEEFRRVSGSAPAPALTSAELDSLRQPGRRARALTGLRMVVMEGRISLPNAGISGTYRAYVDGPRRYRQEIDFGKAGHILQVVNGNHAWTESSFDAPEQLEGLRLRQARIQHPLAVAGALRSSYDRIEPVGSETRDGRKVHVLRLRAGELPPATAYLDPDSGDVVEIESAEVHAFGNVPTSTSFSDYREVRGAREPFRIPHRMVSKLFQSGRSEIVIDTVQTRMKRNLRMFPTSRPKPEE
ncbi:serine hydrolase domain-containing protein [Haliangium sp.]|uniref:serine hydrolase domain-containing protein n=1 Tax=Haliangium sp. TaxID=2663208 RepID=UPI003D0B486C